MRKRHATRKRRDYEDPYIRKQPAIFQRKDAVFSEAVDAIDKAFRISMDKVGPLTTHELFAYFANVFWFAKKQSAFEKRFTRQLELVTRLMRMPEPNIDGLAKAIAMENDERDDKWETYKRQIEDAISVMREFQGETDHSVEIYGPPSPGEYDGIVPKVLTDRMKQYPPRTSKHGIRYHRIETSGEPDPELAEIVEEMTANRKRDQERIEKWMADRDGEV